MFGKVSTQLLAVAAISIPFQLLILLGLNILLAIDRIRQLNLFDALLPAWVFANAVVVLIVLRERLFTLVSSNTGAAIVLGLLLALYIGREVSKVKQSRKARVDLQLLNSMLRYGVKFYISIMAGAIIFRADVLIVNRFRGAAEAGVYAVASQFSFLLLMLPGVIATLLFPRVAASQDERGEFAVQVTRHTTLVMLLMCLAAAALSFVLPWIYGAPFQRRDDSVADPFTWDFLHGPGISAGATFHRHGLARDHSGVLDHHAGVQYRIESPDGAGVRRARRGGDFDFELCANLLSRRCLFLPEDRPRSRGNICAADK